jgi:AsmA family
VVAPFVNAARFSGSIRGALEDSLGREIDFEKVYFSVFPLPGFSLEQVTIQEDPNYGLEPFAYAAGLQARLRIDRLLLGQIRFSSLHLTDPQLNLVKRSDGTWNVVDLIGRLSAPSRMPLSLFPAISMAGGRIDFKFGTRKTTLYIVDSDVSIYRVRSGKIIMQFSGSPARTDRAGNNGFGHLRGTVDWFVNPPDAKANQLDADVTLDPSNLSEITTLIEGHDIGVHGTIGSTAHIEGPAAALRVSGQLRLGDVHRWDLLPSSGDDWRINYSGALDLVSQIFTLQTLPASIGEAVPAALRVRVKQLLTQPAWSIFLTFTKAPVQDLLPLGRRMGLSLPAELQMRGALDGVVGYSNSTGLAGGVAITNAVATLPNIPPLRSAAAKVTISSDNIHIDPAILEAGVGGTLRAGGDYSLSNQHLIASVSADAFPVAALKSTIQTWFGAADALSIWSDGDVTGQFAYNYQGPDRNMPAIPAAWSGKFQFSNATFNIPGLGLPLKHAQGHASFNASTFDLPHFSAALAQQPLTGSYRYNLAAKHPEHVHFELPAADLAQLDAALAPAMEEQSFLSRLAFTRRSIPAWLATRNMEGDAAIHHFSIDGTDVGALSARFIWEGTSLQFTNLQLRAPQAVLKASGVADFAARSPQYHFSATVNDFPWGGGLLSADGRFQSTGRGQNSVRNLRANGSFTGKEISLPATSAFNDVSGLFSFSFANGWPSLQLSNVQAAQEDNNWTGEGSTRSDGKLVVDLAHEGRQLHVVSTLTPEGPSAVVAPLTGSIVSR